MPETVVKIFFKSPKVFPTFLTPNYFRENFGIIGNKFTNSFKRLYEDYGCTYTDAFDLTKYSESGALIDDFEEREREHLRFVDVHIEGRSETIESLLERYARGRKPGPRIVLTDAKKAECKAMAKLLKTIRKEYLKKMRKIIDKQNILLINSFWKLHPERKKQIHRETKSLAARLRH